MQTDGTIVIERKIWCDKENKMREHWIKLWQTEYKDKDLYVKTLQLCQICASKDDKLQPSKKIMKVKDWNVLVCNW